MEQAQQERNKATTPERPDNRAISDVIDNAAITRYKHKLDAKFPIRERDLQNPSYSSLLGCLSIKILIVLVSVVFLALHSLGYDGSEPIEGALGHRMILLDFAVGWGTFGLASVFTYFYVRVKNPAIGCILFACLVAAFVGELFLWNAIAHAGGATIFPIIVIIVCLIPLVMDVWGLITYDSKKQS